MKIPTSNSGNQINVQTPNTDLDFSGVFNSALDFMKQNKEVEMENQKLQYENDINERSIELNNELTETSYKIKNSNMDLNSSINTYKSKFSDLVSKKTNGLPTYYKGKLEEISIEYNNAIFKDLIKHEYIKRDKKFRTDLDDNLSAIHTLAPINRNSLKPKYEIGLQMLENSRGWNSNIDKDISDFKLGTLQSSLKQISNSDSFSNLYKSLLTSDYSTDLITKDEKSILVGLSENERSSLLKSLYDNFVSWNNIQNIENEKIEKQDQNKIEKLYMSIITDENATNEEKLEKFVRLNKTRNLSFTTFKSIENYLTENVSNVDEETEQENLSKLYLRIYSGDTDLNNYYDLIGTEISAKTFGEQIVPKVNALNQGKIRIVTNELNSKFKPIKDPFLNFNRVEMYKLEIKHRVLSDVLNSYLENNSLDTYEIYQNSLSKIEKQEKEINLQEIQKLENEVEKIKEKALEKSRNISREEIQQIRSKKSKMKNLQNMNSVF